MIRPARQEDAQPIVDIYNHYVVNSIVTFEEVPLTVEEMAEYMATITQKLPWLVFEKENDILGYAYAGAWKSRCAYKYSLESTIYLRTDSFGNGIGTKLYSNLINEIKQLGYHAVIGGISLPNAASIALHEKLGFKKIGYFEEVGFKFDKWIDVGYWEIVFGNK